MPGIWYTAMPLAEPAATPNRSSTFRVERKPGQATKTDRLPPVGTDAIWCRSNHNPSLRLLLDEMREYTQSGAPASGPAAGD